MEIRKEVADNGVVQLEIKGKVSRDGWAMQHDPLMMELGPDIYARRVLLGLANVEYIDSTGIEWLLACHHRFKSSNGTLILHSMTPTVRKLLKLMRMDLILNLADSASHAYEKLNTASQPAG